MGLLEYDSLYTFTTMLKQNWRIVSMLERIGDTVIVVLAFFGAYFGRSSLIFWNEQFQLSLPFMGEQLLPIQDYGIVLVVGIIGYAATLSWMGAYGSMRLASVGRLFRTAFVASGLVFLIIASVLFLVKFSFSRSFIGLFVVLCGCGLTLERYFVLKLLRYWRRRGRNYRNVIICGVGHQAQRIAQELRSRPELGIHIRGFADLLSSGAEMGDRYHGLRDGIGNGGSAGRVLRGVEAVAKALQDYAIDEVIFTDIASALSEVEEVISICGEQGIRTTVVADIFSLGLKNSEMSYFADFPLIHFQAPPGAFWALSLKRLIDIVISSTLLVGLLPVFPLIALGVKTTKGPVFYRQRRMGLNGRVFWLLKFRSMIVDAEAGLSELKAKNEMEGPTFKMAADPRVTQCGRFLRRFSLDELPQLWNVFVGDMSLVGPRPPLPGEVSLYDRKSRRRLSMRPGLTCIWQVSGRNEIADFKSWVALDLQYIDNWSLRQDLSLLLKTVPAVLLGRGAH